jgi:hypothetical protein
MRPNKIRFLKKADFFEEMAFSDKNAYIHTTREGKEKESLLQTSLLTKLLLCAKMNLKIKMVDAAKRIKETK